MDFFKKDAKVVVAELRSSEENGLSEFEVKTRIHKHGPNLFTPKQKENIYKKLWDKFREPLILILILSGIISFAMGHIPDGMGIFVAVLLATTIAIIQEGRSDKAFEALSMQSENGNVKVLRADKILYVQKSMITVGDIVYLETGDKVPADARIINQTNFKVDESMLTGESEAVTKLSDRIDMDNIPLGERKNMVYSGTLVIEGRATVVITT